MVIFGDNFYFMSQRVQLKVKFLYLPKILSWRKIMFLVTIIIVTKRSLSDKINMLTLEKKLVTISVVTNIMLLIET